MQIEILLRYHQVPGIENLDTYCRYGGYQALQKAAGIDPEAVIKLTQESDLRGRGGAGYPTAIKWQAVARHSHQPHYFVCNAAEGEPGSFKDRALLKNPHQVLESIAISAYAVGAEKAFLYLRGIFSEEEKLLKHALMQASSARLLGKDSPLPIEIIIHRGEDSYIAGEETALLESLEGKPAIPRTKPPRPSDRGLWDCPTAVNNVETICNIIPILLHGPATFRSYGTKKSTGTKLFCLSGHIQRPGLYEAPLGIRLSSLLNELGGGPLPGRKFLAIFPGGPSTPIVPVHLDPTMDFEGLADVGSALGTGGVVVLDDSADLQKIAVELSDFFARESCRACPPCTYGTSESYRLFTEIQNKTSDPSAAALKIQDFCEMMKFRGNCAHTRAAAMNFLSLFRHFPDSFHLHSQPK